MTILAKPIAEMNDRERNEAFAAFAKERKRLLESMIAAGHEIYVARANAETAYRRMEKLLEESSEVEREQAALALAGKDGK